MIQGENTWATIENMLIATCGDDLSHLLGKSQVSYDGMYEIAAEEQEFTRLCQYYPLIETVVQDVAEVRVRLRNKSTVPMGTDTEVIQVKAGSSSVTEAIMRPESIVAVPAYLLRFVPFVGSAPVLIAVALRQAFYRTSHDQGFTQIYPRQGDSVTVDVAALLRSLGEVISRAKFFRLFKEEKMSWFVSRSDAEHTFKDGRIQRLPNTYQYRGLLLTPGDASDLYDWLQKHDIRGNPIEVLTEALRTGRDNILQFPYRTPDSANPLFFDQAVSVHHIVTLALESQRLNTILASLCDALTSHLIRPESFLAIPWYWFRKVLPQLGDDLGALYLLSKNCCYIDWAHGQDRNTFWVPGGLPTLQAWIGSASLPKRIPQKEPSQRGRPRNQEVKENTEYVRAWRDEKRTLASLYLCRVDTRRTETGLDWQLEVNDTQLIDDDIRLRDTFYDFMHDPKYHTMVAALPTQLDNKDFVNLLQRASRDKGKDAICHFDTLVSMGICNFDTLGRQDIINFDTLVDALICHFETLVRNKICHFDTIINILLKLKNTFQSLKYIQPPNTKAPDLQFVTLEDQKEVVAGYYKAGKWQLSKILSRINPLLANQIQERVQVEIFVSWLIYGSLTSQINSPLSFAVSRALESGQDAGGPAWRLANLDPDNLAEQLWHIKQRLEAGYLGDQHAFTATSSDLRHFFSSVESTSEKLFLIQRLADALGIHAGQD